MYKRKILILEKSDVELSKRKLDIDQITVFDLNIPRKAINKAYGIILKMDGKVKILKDAESEDCIKLYRPELITN